LPELGRKANLPTNHPLAHFVNSLTENDRRVSTSEIGAS